MCGIFIFDAFGGITGFRYSGHHRLRSNIGGLMTIISILVAIIAIFVHGKIYIDGKEITQVNNQLKYWGGQNITLKDTFNFAIANKIDGKIEYNNNLFSIEAFYVEYNVEKYELKERRLNNTACNIKDWKNVEKQFISLKLENALCFELNNYEISGNRNTQWFKYLRIKYMLNISDTNDDWNKYVERTIVDNDSSTQLYFLEGVFETTQESSDINYFINSIPLNISYFDNKEMTISISEDELITKHDKLLTTNKSKNQSYVIYDVRETTSLRENTNKKFVTIDIVSSKVKNSITVSFLSFSDLLARIGGIVNTIVTIFFYFNHIRNYWNYEVDQLNQVLNKLEIDFSIKNDLIPIKNNIRLMKRQNEMYLNNNLNANNSNINNFNKNRDAESKANANRAENKNSNKSNELSFSEKDLIKINENNLFASNQIQNNNNSILSNDNIAFQVSSNSNIKLSSFNKSIDKNKNFTFPQNSSNKYKSNNSNNEVERNQIKESTLLPIKFNFNNHNDNNFLSLNENFKIIDYNIESSNRKRKPQLSSHENNKSKEKKSTIKYD